MGLTLRGREEVFFLFLLVVKQDNICHFSDSVSTLISSLSPSTCLHFPDQYYPAYLTNLIQRPIPQHSQPLVCVCVWFCKSPPGSRNIIQAYGFHLEWKPNLYAPKIKWSVFFFSQNISYSLPSAMLPSVTKSHNLGMTHAAIIWELKDDKLMLVLHLESTKLSSECS